MHGFWSERDEIPECVVRRCGLRETAVRLHFYGMDQVGELDGVLDKEDRDVISDQVPVSFFRVKLDRKSAYVPRRVHRTCAACHSRNASEHRRLLPYFGKYPGGGVFLQRASQLKVPV